MALDVRKKRRRRLSMTSLIDVIFLLLLFFMLTSTFSKFGEIEFTAAAAGGPETDRAIRFVKLEANRILVDGTLVSFEDVAARLTDSKPQTALISLSQDATSQQLIDLLSVLKGIDQLRAQVIG
ncbi:biopolymer transporter ExbD [Ruegeria sp. Ofav3-42]|uniref:ExbD/TolR family protein n=1 Tax=Ruegeria sp. Ofav3-42 TaxID=2917759 RepID=UPI001EF5C9A7|nr:biopolymer transporter ExbD [Ruegeria sp. Ofav3-42]MCG7519041.1 biopolymer transporter ExbD [Ruegeria sp. Ofav3-42]